MSNISCNCIICANEFNDGELIDLSLSELNNTKYKVCKACFNSSSPEEDYKEVKALIDYYDKSSETISAFAEVIMIMKEAKVIE